jgi:hypothetical protein
MDGWKCSGIQFTVDKKSQNNTVIELDVSVEAGTDNNHVPCCQENDRGPYAPLAYGY